MNATNITRERMLMNPHTGSVDTEENWRADFESMTPEEWGSCSFEDSDLVEVNPDTHEEV